MFEKKIIAILSIIGIDICTAAFVCLANEFLGSASPLSIFVKTILAIAGIAGMVIVQTIHASKCDG